MHLQDGELFRSFQDGKITLPEVLKRANAFPSREYQKLIAQMLRDVFAPQKRRKAKAAAK